MQNFTQKTNLEITPLTTNERVGNLKINSANSSQAHLTAITTWWFERRTKGEISLEKLMTNDQTEIKLQYYSYNVDVWRLVSAVW